MNALTSITFSRPPVKIVLGLGYLIMMTGLLHLLFPLWAYDDPYITYRYAHNLAQGIGLVYNPGEHVLSTTTPLFAILLGLLSFLWANIPRLANFIGAFSLALGGLFIWYLAQAWETPEAGWAGLLLYPTFSLPILTLGSETPTYLLFCISAFAFYAHKRYGLAAAVAALAVLTRPDGILIPAILAAHYLLVNRGQIPWRAGLIFAVILLPWTIFAWAYFGSPIPVTLAAKQGQGLLQDSHRFAAGFLDILAWYKDNIPYWLEAGLALAGLGWAFMARRRWLLFLAWPLLYFVSYTLLGVSAYYWYYAPFVPGFIAAMGLCIAWLRNSLAEVSSLPRQSAGLAAAALLLFFGLVQTSGLLELRSRPDERARIYRAVGEWLQHNTPEDSSVGALEVGIIGYYAQRLMIDFAGLIQEDVAARFSPQFGYQEAASWAFDRYRPEYLVVHEGLFPAFERELSAADCSREREFPGQDFGYSGNIGVYHCPR